MVEINKAARNEQRKVTATFINGGAIAIFAIGVFTPVFQFFAGTGNPSLLQFALVVICILVAGALHYLARYLLRGIEE
jgi:Na+/H+-dicarboxylate symporter